jgi:alkyl sulfatase BDS1-like metallo-beta-lactamase superfamily hydrolase
MKNSDAEDHVAKRFPKKKTKQVGNSLRPRSVDGFLRGVSLVFQPNKSAGVDCTYHFTFTGDEQRKVTIVIRDKKITAEEGHVGEPDLHVTADSKTWLGFLAKEKSLVWALLRRKIRMKGSPKLLIAFGKYFPQ